MRALIGILLATQMTLPCLAQNFALHFAGDRRAAQVNNPMVNARSKFTWEAWVQPGEPPLQSHVFFHHASYSEKALFISSTQPGSLQVLLHFLESVGGGASGEKEAIATVSYTPGNWLHVAASYDGIQMKVFVNGELSAAESAPQYNGNLDWTDDYFGSYIGGNLREDDGNGPFYRGDIDEVRAWTVARSEAEIRDNMHRHIDGPEPGLVGSWSFDEGSGQLIHDSSGEQNDGLLGLTEAAESSDPSWTPSATPVTYPQVQITQRCGHAPLEVGFALRDSSDVASVTWNFGDGTSSGELNPSHTYTQEGSYSAEVTVVKTGGEELTFDGPAVTVGTPPEARFSIEPQRGTAPLTVHFTDESLGDLRSHRWDFGDGSVAQGSNPQHTYQKAGIYEVQLTVTGSCADATNNVSTSAGTVIVGSLPSVELVPAGPRCVALVLTNATPVTGGEVGIGFDPSVITPVRVKVDSGLPQDAIVRFQANADVLCPPVDGITAGFTIGWVNSLTDSIPTAPGRHRLLRVCFELAGEAQIGSCSPLSFVQCLGVPGAPVRNIVTETDGSSTELFATNGLGCVLPELRFRRGDSNLDGSFDISDAVSTLACLFLGAECPGCPDAADGNDDGIVNIADPIYLLNWRFSGSAAPAAPFLECGVDPTSDDLDDCEGFPACQ